MKTFWASAILAASVGGIGSVNSAENDKGYSATPQEKVILERQHFMEGLYALYDDMEDAPGNGSDLRRLRLDAETIADTLPALAYMFPPDTNSASPKFRAKTFQTYALPAIWKNPARFRTLLQAAVKTAGELSSSSSIKIEEFAPRMNAACEACHTEFRAEILTPLDKLEAEKAKKNAAPKP